MLAYDVLRREAGDLAGVQQWSAITALKSLPPAIRFVSIVPKIRR
jgi:hypothetical protein